VATEEHACAWPIRSICKRLLSQGQWIGLICRHERQCARLVEVALRYRRLRTLRERQALCLGFSFSRYRSVLLGLRRILLGLSGALLGLRRVLLCLCFRRRGGGEVTLCLAPLPERIDR